MVGRRKSPETVDLHWVLTSRLDFDRDGGDSDKSSLSNGWETADAQERQEGLRGLRGYRERSRKRLVQKLACQLESCGILSWGVMGTHVWYLSRGGAVLLVGTLSGSYGVRG